MIFLLDQDFYVKGLGLGITQKKDHHTMQNLDQDQQVSDNDSDNQDIISSLPDCMLSHILSFLPTKDAFKTFILSTRWRNLCFDPPNIDLNDDDYVYEEFVGITYSNPDEFNHASFLKFVDRLLTHRITPTITRLRVLCKTLCFSSRYISKWISSVTMMQVKELELDLQIISKTLFPLPCCVFSCQSLRVLKLHMKCVLVITDDQTVLLSNLKILNLVAVVFSDQESVDKLFSGCPVLEELSLSNHCCDNYGRVSISSPTVRKFRIHDIRYPALGSPASAVKLDMANLVSLSYIGSCWTDVLVVNPTSVLEASLIVVRQSNLSGPSTSAIDIITALQNVEFLRTSIDTIKDLSWSSRFYGELPLLPKLTQMEIRMGTEDHILGCLSEFLRNSPHLETLTFEEGLAAQSYICRDVCIKLRVSKCCLPRLKLINFHFVHGNETEMRVLKFLVESAPELEIVEVTCSDNLSVFSKEYEIGRQVQRLLRSSRANLKMRAYKRGSNICRENVACMM